MYYGMLTFLVPTIMFSTLVLVACSLIVETLGLWTDYSVTLFHCIAACTTSHNGVSPVASPSTIYYNSFLLSNDPTVPGWYCTTFHSCQWLRTTPSLIPSFLFPPP